MAKRSAAWKNGEKEAGQFSNARNIFASGYTHSRAQHPAQDTVIQCPQMGLEGVMISLEMLREAIWAASLGLAELWLIFLGFSFPLPTGEISLIAGGCNPTQVPFPM